MNTEPLQGKTVFITGGAGFIASHLLDRIVRDNKVITYDSYIRSQGIRAGHPNVTAIEGDVLDYSHLLTSSEGADILIHCAAIAGIYSVGSNLATTMKVNLIGSYNALEATLQNKIGRFIDFSTSEVYGPMVYGGKETDSTILGPVGERRWVYAASKIASEHLTHAYAKEYGLKASSVRPFNVYGPRQVGEGAIQQMILKALANEDITVYNDGLQIRAWCYISDFIDALCLLLEREANTGDEVFNIGNPQTSITVLGLAEKIREMTHSRSSIIFKEHPGAEIEMRIPNIEKAKSLLGFEPQVDLDEGLQRTIKWYKENRCNKS